ncbi:MAG: TIGR04053 family radical SAM/SPASM domain-containing protein [Chloroflexi bacterium]|nr:TIGR04053 family radical SAM/SPASM domain-containing protein [Chloroflexota bacterium]
MRPAGLLQEGNSMSQHSLENPPLRVIAWESTRACNLVCRHCRASAQETPSPDELTTDEMMRLVDQIAAFSQPIFIISGGEPLMRPDVFDIAAYATEKGLRVAISPNGTLITPHIVQRMHESGIKRVSVSIDGSCAERHDGIRGVSGSFDKAVRGMGFCQDGGIPFQVNTTVMRQNVDDLEAAHQLVVSLGAVAWHVFMLVPTGRGKVDDEITPQAYEEILNWVYDAAQDSPIPLRVTCGPQFMRMVLTRQKDSVAPPNLVRKRGGGGHPGGLDRMSRGCLAGMGYCFVSHSGGVYPCGYLPVQAGDIREQDFQTIYEESSVFASLRDLSRLEGKCGVCSFARRCGGCRARAYGITGNYLAEEPYCVYEPHQRGQDYA